MSYNDVAVVSGAETSTADVLCAGPMCGRNGSNLLLASSITDASNLVVTNNIVPHMTEISHGYIIGGPVAVSASLEVYLKQVCR